ncbi:MAG: LytTR family DNA-binding domain-containing protein [Spirochaetia bacterium]|nr:LytTR family DNA-binding domain-containing protein [Spirochaetia bacterium]
MRILIVEDESVAARGLERKLRSILGTRIQSLRIERTLIGSECFIQDSSIDVLFLDLDLNGDDGFLLLEEAAAGSFHTIIVSANTDRALEAFDYGVIDFVPKPVLETRLQRAIDRLTSGPEKPLKYLSVREDDRVHLVPLTDVIYLEGDDNHVQIHCRNGATFKHRKTLDSLEKLLTDSFVRIHRRYLVASIELQSIQVASGGKYTLSLAGGIELPVSRSFYSRFKK